MLQVQGLSKSYKTADGQLRAVQNVDLDLADGELVALVGPSGCGKTTTLRCVAGLERPDAGEIRIGGTLAAAPASGVHEPAYARDVGMVFQSYAIWPHFDVFENVAYPLRVRRPRVPRREIGERVRATLALVGLEALARRPATALSGGQQQRVALARALVHRPRLLLLDEPLSNLDAGLREQMQDEIGDLVRRLHVTTLYVTHDQAEALGMADRVAVMVNGRLVQADRPEALYGRPGSRAVAEFLAPANLIPGTIVEIRDGGRGTLVLDGEAGRLEMVVPEGARAGDSIEVSIRGEELELAAADPGDRGNILTGTVERVRFRGSSRECHVRVAGSIVRARLNRTVEVHPGDRVWLAADPARAVVFRR